ncbi:UNKNOWN [Stylonychia lemnae]|uniref:Uncharacterized protein n=1 Tax=Stylonychia lemnae TaxID=5949 RepID=A0A078AZN5_STYLE|nr:UNKNOWN [Stylonychia lemnae]|eukprot:CDW87659.1 UNKNOWN [Stylonychia lemnae]
MSFYNSQFGMSPKSAVSRALMVKKDNGSYNIPDEKQFQKLTHLIDTFYNYQDAQEILNQNLPQKPSTCLPLGQGQNNRGLELIRKTQVLTAENSPNPGTRKSQAHKLTGEDAVKEYENFNNHKSNMNKDLDIDPGSQGNYLTSKQKDKQQMKMLNKYLNFSLMKLNDEFVQRKFKTYLKAQSEQQGSRDSVYDRLQKNANENVQKKLLQLSQVINEPSNRSSALAFNHAEQLKQKLKFKIQTNLNTNENQLNVPRASRISQILLKSSGRLNTSHFNDDPKYQELVKLSETSSDEESQQLNQNEGFDPLHNKSSLTFSNHQYRSFMSNMEKLSSQKKSPNLRNSILISNRLNETSGDEKSIKSNSGRKCSFRRSQIVQNTQIFINQPTGKFKEYEEKSPNNSKNSRRSGFGQRKHVRIYDPQMEIDKRLDVIERQVITSQHAKRSQQFFSQQNSPSNRVNINFKNQDNHYF